MLSLLKNIAKLAVILVLAGYALIWILSPYVARHYISQYLKPQQLKLVEESVVRYNPFLSKLSIENLAISTVKGTNKEETQEVLALSSLMFQISAYRLILDQFYVSEFDISGLHVIIDRETGGEREALTVAGVTIPVISQKQGGADAVIPKEELPASNLLLQLLMSKMTLRDSSVVIIENGYRHILQLDNVDVDAVKASQLMQDFSLSLTGNLDGADIDISVHAALENGLGRLNIETEIEDIDINDFKHFARPHLDDLQGLITYQAKHNITLSEGLVSIEFIGLNIQSKGLTANKNAIYIELTEQEFKSERINIIAKTDSALRLSGESTLVFKGLNVYKETKEQVLVALKEVAFDQLRMTSEGGLYEVAINNVTTQDAFFSDNTESALPALTQFVSLAINDVMLTNTGLEINTVELAGLKSNVQLDEKKVLRNLIASIEELSSALSTESQATESQASVEEAVLDKSNDFSKSNVSAADADFSVKLNDFHLADHAEIYFSDSSVSPNYKRNVFLTNFSAGPFDTQQPDLNSVIAIKGRSNQYDNFDIKVDAKPFLELPTYLIDSKIKEVHLTDLSGYIKQALGYEIDSGQLDLEIQTKLIGTAIKGDAQILLRGIKLTSVDEHESGSLNEATSIPFNLALGMLKDSDGNVELNLPLSGDTSSPSFGLSGFLTLVVKRATIAAAKEYLTMTFVPYAGLVKVVMAADDYLLKVEINNLEYKAEEFEVPEDKEEFLADFAALLTDKSDLQVKLCGVASMADIGKISGASVTTKDDVQKLILISEQRAVNFKQYMVEEKKISSSRLLLCKPKVDLSSGAIPHIKFEI